ncbi:MAG: M3 family oligoendopeptidase [Acutalibacteraceae bacterium]|nr:M3 family oligoendopeptidase [Acutalibacteraceae bacterium]
MQFSAIPYERPDLEEVRQQADRIRQDFAHADTFETADAAWLAWDKLTAHVDTMMSLAYIRHSIDTTDTFYEQEVDYIDEISPVFTEIQQSFTKLLVESRFRKELTEKYGRLPFLNGEIFLKAFSPDIIPETQQTNQLETAYQKLLASAQIPFDGENRTLAQLGPYKKSADDTIRRSAWKAESDYYSSIGQELDDIYDKLVHLRTQIGHKLGYANFVEPGYLQMNRNCYTAKDVASFRQAVIKHIVPIADRLYRTQAQRTGLSYPFTFADAALQFRDGNPKPQGSADDILRTAQDLYHSLSTETTDFIDLLFHDELLDVLSKKGKAGGGYCTQLADYKVPFIFANFNGTADDVEVMTHEAGHAFAFYMARDLVPSDLQSPTLEACEIHSMTMEFFGWRKSEEFFGKDAAKFRYSHLFNAITFIPYGTMVDHFQHIMYEQPDLSPAQRHEVWKELLGVYMPWMQLDGSPFYGEGKGWQRQMHIYENPFYYIDYCLAQTVALEFWAIMQKNHADAWERYMRLVRKAGTQTFEELVATAGLASPFHEDALQTVAEAASQWLENNLIG